jgi:arginine:agmatine antiporter
MASDVRKIGLFPATMLVAGNMIGAGIFMMPTIMASIGGISTLGWLVTAPGAFIMGYMFARLGRARPVAGGPYAYAREALGDFAGFQCNLLYWFSNVVANIAIATSMTGYLTVFMPFLKNPYLAAASTITLIWLSAGLNMIGPRIVTRFETWTTLLVIGPIAFVGFAGWYSFDPAIFKLQAKPRPYLPA